MSAFWFWTRERLEERGVGRGSSRRSSLEKRESVIVSQTNIRTDSKATLRKLLRDRVVRMWASLKASSKKNVYGMKEHSAVNQLRHIFFFDEVTNIR